MDLKRTQEQPMNAGMQQSSGYWKHIPGNSTGGTIAIATKGPLTHTPNPSNFPPNLSIFS